MKKGIVDNLDVQILGILQENSRLSSHQLSKRLGKAAGTLMKRISDLQNEGVVKKYTIVVNPTKLGYTYTSVFFVQTNGHVELIKNTIAKMANVVFIYQITGDFDVVLVAKFKDSGELTMFAKQLLEMTTVQRVITGVALDVIKEDVTSLL